MFEDMADQVLIVGLISSSACNVGLLYLLRVVAFVLSNYTFIFLCKVLCNMCIMFSFSSAVLAILLFLSFTRLN